MILLYFFGMFISIETFCSQNLTRPTSPLSIPTPFISTQGRKPISPRAPQSSEPSVITATSASRPLPTKIQTDLRKSDSATSIAPISTELSSPRFANEPSSSMREPETNSGPKGSFMFAAHRISFQEAQTVSSERQLAGSPENPKDTWKSTVPTVGRSVPLVDLLPEVPGSASAPGAPSLSVEVRSYPINHNELQERSEKATRLIKATSRLLVEDDDDNELHMVVDLTRAARDGDFKRLNELLSSISDKTKLNAVLNSSVDINGKGKVRTALQCAVEQNRVDICRVLMDKGANPLIKDAKGLTALHYAALKDYDLVLRLLLKYSRTREGLEHRDAEGRTPLNIALLENHFECASILSIASVDYYKSLSEKLFNSSDNNIESIPGYSSTLLRRRSSNARDGQDRQQDGQVTEYTFIGDDRAERPLPDTSVAQSSYIESDKRVFAMIRDAV